MNIVNTLTIRHIKTHKKRSILTIMAIIVSVAMVTAVFTSAQSFVVYFQNVTKAIDGNWHSYVHTDDFLGNEEKFVNDDIEKYGVDLWYGSAIIDKNSDELGMDINAVDEDYLEMRNVKISEGKMPTKANELLLNRSFVKKQKLGWKIGDKIALKTLVGEDYIDIDYTVVGFTDSKVAETDSVDAFTLATDDYIKQHGDTSVYIRYTKLDKSVYDKTKALYKSVNTNTKDEVLGYNNTLLTYSGVTTDDVTLKILYGFCAIILAIIAVVSIFMIYDSFAVSYQERARYLGMLASVGATKKQKRNSIYFEGFILGLIGIPLGIIAGIGGIWLTFKGIEGVWAKTLAVEYDGALAVRVNWIVILGTVIASAITIFVSSYIPAIKASKTTAIDAIRQANTVKVKKAKRLKNSRLATKLLGYEGAMAVKNFKRNGRRSRTIVFSLFMSVVVFLSVANFSLMFSDLMKSNYSENADLIVSVDYQDANKLDKALSQTDGISSCYCIDCEYNSIDTSLINPDAKSLFTNDQVIMAFVDNETLDAYLKQLGEDNAKYHDLKNPTGILHNTALTRDGEKKIKVQPLVNLEGKRLETEMNIFNPDPEAEKQSIIVDPLVGVQTTQDYKNDMFFYQDMHLPLMMLSIDMAPQYFAKSDLIDTKYSAQITCDDSNAVEIDLRDNATSNQGITNIQIYNATSEMEAINNILTIVKVFVFGFITLITLISIMNIVNTISNSINERRREFAMIRSVGMTPKSFKKMIYYESFRYGLKSLMFSVPISAGIHYLMYYQLAKGYDYGFKPQILVFLIAIVAVFVIIGIALVYSISKIKDDNIIETLKLDIN